MRSFRGKRCVIFAEKRCAFFPLIKKFQSWGGVRKKRCAVLASEKRRIFWGVNSGILKRCAKLALRKRRIFFSSMNNFFDTQINIFYENHNFLTKKCTKISSENGASFFDQNFEGSKNRQILGSRKFALAKTAHLFFDFAPYKT